MNFISEPIEATISELRPRMKNVTIIFKVIEKGEVREVISRRDRETHRVQDAIVGDSSAIVTVPLWNDSIEEVKVGKSYILENGHTRLFRYNLRLKIARYGEINDAENEVEKVNEETDMSVKKHETYRRRRHVSYGYHDSRCGGYGGYNSRSGRSGYRSYNIDYGQHRR